MLEVLGVLVGFVALVLMIGVTVDCTEAFNPVYTLVDSWNRLKEKLNLVGCIICIIPIGIISLPGMILSFVLIAIFCGVDWFWKGFMYVFRKRK